MFKIRFPYSAIVALVTFGLQTPLWIVAIMAGTVELVSGIAILIKLRSANKFEYDSFYGHLLAQFTPVSNIGIYDIEAQVGARLAAFIMLGFQFWFCIPAIILYLTTVVHYIKPSKV